jgi:AraC-like DNA-binding protein
LILKEEKPKKSNTCRFIDRYQFYRFDDKSVLKAIPNGKIELYFVLQGTLEMWDSSLEAFISCGEDGIFPATNQVSFYRIPDYLVCLNIKLNLKTLSLPSFNGLLNRWKNISVADLLGGGHLRSIRTLTEDFSLQNSYVDQLDAILENVFSEPEQKSISSLLDRVEEELSEEFKVYELAKILNISTKTLERKTQKYFNLSPKELLNVIRFENTSAYIQQSEAPCLLDALAFGYYDQSHFIKDCRKITGYTPKDFFSKLSLPTNDLIAEQEVPGTSFAI